MAEVRFPVVIPIRVDDAQFRRRMATVGNSTSAVRGKMSDLQKLAGGLFAGFSAAVIVNELRKIGSAIVSTGAMFQTLGIQLETQFGDKSTQVFADIKKFALDSPGQVSGITAAWIGLKSIGIDPTIESMRVLDDIASSSLNAATGQARKLEDLAEAIRGAITGETERLKAFNIIARITGETITLAFKDTEIEVKRSAKEIFEAIQEIGAVNFPGAALRQMDSFAGSASNLEDAMDSLSDSIFRSGLGDFLTNVNRALTEGVTALGDWISKGDEMERLLKRLVPASDKTAEAVDRVTRSIENQNVQRLLQEYKSIAEELELFEQRLADLPFKTSIENSGILGERILLLREALKASGIELDEARQNLIDVATGAKMSAAETAALAAAADAAALSEKELNEALKEQRRIALENVDALQELRLIQQSLSAVGPIQLIEGGRLQPEVIRDFAGEAQRAAEVMARQVGDVIVTSAGEMTIMMRETGEDVGSIWAREITVAGRKVGLSWGDVLASAISALVSVARDFGRRETGQFGGRLTGDFADEGAQIGGAVLGGIGTVVGGVLGGPAGAAIGNVIGTVVGEVLGGVIGGAIKQGADEGLASLRQIGDDVAIQITRDEGGLGGVALQIGQAFNAALGAVEATLRGQIDIAGFDIKIRDDVISIFINGLTGQFDNISDAVEFALVESLKDATFFGAGAAASPEVLQALQAFTGDSIDHLNQLLALALRQEQGRIGPAAAAVQDTVRGIMDDLFAAVQAGIDPSGSIANLERTRNAILGIQEDLGRAKEAEIEAFNAELLIREAGLQVLLAEVEARGFATQAHAETVKAFTEISAASIQAENARVQAMASSTAVTIQLASAAADATASILAAIEAIQGLRIDDAAARRAIAAARRAGRRVGGAPRGPAAREADFTEDLLQQLERLRIGEDAAALSAFELALQLEATRERLEQSTLSEQDRAELLDLIRQQFADREAARLAEIARLEEEAAAEVIRLAEEVAAEQIRLAEEAQQAAEDAAQAVVDMINGLRRGLDSVAAGAIGVIQRALPFIENPEERERLQQRLVEMEQLLFRLSVESARIELESLRAQLILLESLDPIRAAWIENLLGDLDIISGNMGAIFDGIADTVVSAGQSFATAVHGAAGALGGVVPLIITNMEAFRQLIFSPPRTATEVQEREGLLLAQLLARIEALQNPPGTLSPAEALMQMVRDLEPFFEAFGLSFEEITAQVQGLIDSEEIVDAGRSMQAWLDLQRSLMPGGALSGDSDQERLAILKAQILSAVARGNFDEAAKLGQAAVALASGISGAQLASISSLILGLPPAGLTGPGAGTGIGTGRDAPFANEMNAFERNSAQRHMATEENRFTIAEIQIGLAEETNRLLAERTPATRRPALGTSLGARPLTQATLLANAETKG